MDKMAHITVGVKIDAILDNAFWGADEIIISGLRDGLTKTEINESIAELISEAPRKFIDNARKHNDIHFYATIPIATNDE